MNFKFWNVLLLLTVTSMSQAFYGLHDEVSANNFEKMDNSMLRQVKEFFYVLAKEPTEYPHLEKAVIFLGPNQTMTAAAINVLTLDFVKSFWPFKGPLSPYVLRPFYKVRNKYPTVKRDPETGINFYEFPSFYKYNTVKNDILTAQAMKLATENVREFKICLFIPQHFVQNQKTEFQDFLMWASGLFGQLNNYHLSLLTVVVTEKNYAKRDKNVIEELNNVLKTALSNTFAKKNQDNEIRENWNKGYIKFIKSLLQSKNFIIFEEPDENSPPNKITLEKKKVLSSLDSLDYFDNNGQNVGHALLDSTYANGKKWINAVKLMIMRKTHDILSSWEIELNMKGKQLSSYGHLKELKERFRVKAHIFQSLDNVSEKEVFSVGILVNEIMQEVTEDDLRTVFVHFTEFEQYHGYFKFLNQIFGINFNVERKHNDLSPLEFESLFENLGISEQTDEKSSWSEFAEMLQDYLSSFDRQTQLSFKEMTSLEIIGTAEDFPKFLDKWSSSYAPLKEFKERLNLPLSQKELDEVNRIIKSTFPDIKITERNARLNIPSTIISGKYVAFPKCIGTNFSPIPRYLIIVASNTIFLEGWNHTYHPDSNIRAPYQSITFISPNIEAKGGELVLKGSIGRDGSGYFLVKTLDHEHKKSRIKHQCKLYEGRGGAVNGNYAPSVTFITANLKGQASDYIARSSTHPGNGGNGADGHIEGVCENTETAPGGTGSNFGALSVIMLINTNGESLYWEFGIGKKGKKGLTASRKGHGSGESFPQTDPPITFTQELQGKWIEHDSYSCDQVIPDALQMYLCSLNEFFYPEEAETSFIHSGLWEVLKFSLHQYTIWDITRDFHQILDLQKKMTEPKKITKVYQLYFDRIYSKNIAETLSTCMKTANTEVPCNAIYCDITWKDYRSIDVYRQKNSYEFPIELSMYLLTAMHSHLSLVHNAQNIFIVNIAGYVNRVKKQALSYKETLSSQKYFEFQKQDAFDVEKNTEAYLQQVDSKINDAYDIIKASLRPSLENSVSEIEESIEKLNQIIEEAKKANLNLESIEEAEKQAKTNAIVRAILKQLTGLGLGLAVFNGGAAVAVAVAASSVGIPEINAATDNSQQEKSVKYAKEQRQKFLDAGREYGKLKVPQFVRFEGALNSTEEFFDEICWEKFPNIKNSILTLTNEFNLLINQSPPNVEKLQSKQNEIFDKLAIYRQHILDDLDICSDNLLCQEGIRDTTSRKRKRSANFYSQKNTRVKREDDIKTKTKATKNLPSVATIDKFVEILRAAVVGITDELTIDVGDDSSDLVAKIEIIKDLGISVDTAVLPLLSKMEAATSSWDRGDPQIVSLAQISAIDWKMEENMLAIENNVVKLDGFLWDAGFGHVMTKLFGVLEKITEIQTIAGKYIQDKHKVELMATIALPQFDVQKGKNHYYVINLQLQVAQAGLLHLYSSVINVLKQVSFPFAEYYLAGYELPKVNLTTQELSQFVSYTIGEIDTLLFQESKWIVDGSSFEETFTESNTNETYAFYTWPSQKFEQDIRRLLSGRSVYFFADILESNVYRDCVKARTFDFKFVIRNSNQEVDTKKTRDLQNVLKYFKIVINHSGISSFRFKNRFYTFSGPAIQISYRLKTGAEISLLFNKLVGGNYVLSPYTSYKIKLIRDNPDVKFEKLKKFLNEKIDLLLEGQGLYIQNNIPGTPDYNVGTYFVEDKTLGKIYKERLLRTEETMENDLEIEDGTGVNDRVQYKVSINRQLGIPMVTKKMRKIKKFSLYGDDDKNTAFSQIRSRRSQKDWFLRAVGLQ